MDKKKLSGYITKKQIAKNVGIFIVVAACILFYFAVYRFDTIWIYIKKIMSVIKPIIYGLAFAYIINQMVKPLEKRISVGIMKANNLRKKASDKLTQPTHSMKMSARGISIFISIMVFLAVIIALFMFIGPELLRSVMGMINEIPMYIDRFNEWFNHLVNQENEAAAAVVEIVNNVTAYFENWVNTDLLSTVNKIAAMVASSAFNFVGELLNWFVGIIVSIYVLMDKEKLSGTCKKIIYAIFSPLIANEVLDTFRDADEKFGGFLVGKIIDSLIIGMICFIVLTLMNMPYTLLVSVIVGVTNIIPFFGPYIGGVPSALLILLVNPLKGLYFIIFIVILQQIDGNILGPKILSNKTNLSPFWVVFSILLAGGLFGIVGMIVGVPTFAVIYTIIKKIISYILRLKNIEDMPAVRYSEVKKIDCETNELIYKEDGNGRER